MKRLWFVVGIFALLPAVLWFFIDPDFSRFSSLRLSIFSLGQIAGLVGLSLFSLNILLSARLPGIEKLFGPLNKITIVHHLIGVSVWILLGLHPIGLLAIYGPSLIFSLELSPILLGKTALLLFSGLLVLTLFVKIPYHIWKLTHRLMGPVLLIGGFHSFLVGSNISYFLPLKIYYFVVLTAAFLAWIYHSSPARRFLVPKYPYLVDRVTKTGEFTEIIFRPLAAKMQFIPGQFAFFSIQVPGFQESQPFSLASAPGENLRLVSKNIGDYTAKLASVPLKSRVNIEGPYGRFSYFFHPRPRQIWIAGGIGITPFLSMLSSLPAKNKFRIDLYYVCKSKTAAYGLVELQKKSVKNTVFRLTPYFSDVEKARLTAETVFSHSGDLSKADIFICGPLSMMKSLRSQFNQQGIRHSHIHTEEFSLN